MKGNIKYLYYLIYIYIYIFRLAAIERYMKDQLQSQTLEMKVGLFYSTILTNFD